MPWARWASTLLWLPLNFLQGAFTLLWSALWIALALGVRALAGEEEALAMARTIWAPGLLVGAGAHLSVRGLEAIDLSRPYLVVANHQSWIDVPALFRAFPIPLRFLAKRELARVPFLGAYLKATGMVLIARDALREKRGSVTRARELLAGDRGAVVSFPEGTRSRDGRLGGFRSGGFAAALESGAAVLPVAIAGAGRVLPAGGFRVRPGTIEVVVGRPIDSARFAPANRAGLAEAAENAVAELLAGVGAAP
jgi:1-acyl-sn-glycerol-3-phosphate acyltransferase